MVLKKIVSFGYKWGEPESIPGVMVVDLRQMFRNPYRNRSLRYKLGANPEVQSEVLKTPNFRAKYDHLKTMTTVPGIHEVWIGCHGGKHRSVFLAEKLGQELQVPVEHRDVAKE